MKRPLSDKAYAALLAASGTHASSLAGLGLYDHRNDARVVKPLVAQGYMTIVTTPLQSQYYRLTPEGVALFEAERERRRQVLRACRYKTNTEAGR